MACFAAVSHLSRVHKNVFLLFRAEWRDSCTKLAQEGTITNQDKNRDSNGPPLRLLKRRGSVGMTNPHDRGLVGGHA